MTIVKEERNGSAAVCPYCGAEHEDMWEHKQESDKMKCCDCEKTFRWRREVEVEYVSECDCEDNNEKHDYVEPEEWMTNDKGIIFKIADCSKCTEYSVIYKKTGEGK